MAAPSSSRNPPLWVRRHLWHPMSLLLIGSALLALVLPSEATVELPMGNVVGKVCSFQPTVRKFYGIPYGEPPVGNLRFRPSAIYNRSYPNLYLDATSPPPPCPQSIRPVSYLPTTTSEDCLFLNVWTPVNATSNSLLPVRVYVHGGNFASSHASEFELDGCKFVAKTGVIQVNIQYRLGPLGFLAHPYNFIESNTTGNWGIMDQQLALKWVQRYISYFGGDPSRVLLFGHSAGAWSVNILASLSSSRGLFNAVASMSSPGFTSSETSSYALSDYGQAFMLTKNFSTILKCGSELTIEQLECLRNTSVDDLLDAVTDSGVIYMSMPINQAFFPIVDGKFIPNQIIDAIQIGDFVNVSYLISTVKDEGRFSFAVSGYASTWTANDLADFLEYIYPGANQTSILNMYPLFKYDVEKYKIYGIASDIWTDVFIACPNYDTMKALYQQGATLYGYYMTHPPSCEYLYDYEYLWLGATHGDDIYFVFGDTTNLPPPSGSCNLDEDEVELSDIFINGFASMASDGYPSLQNGTVWPQWTPSNPLKTIMDLPVSFGTVDFSEKCEVFNQLHQATKPSNYSQSHPNRPVPKILQFLNKNRRNYASH